MEDGLYCLIGNTMIDSIPLTLTGSWKQGTRTYKHLYKVFFTVRIDTCVTGFQVIDDS